MADDPRTKAERYRLGLPPDEPDAPPSGDPGHPTPTAEQRAAFVEVSIQQAVRRGDFDDLRGAGKPLADLGRTNDPDWWIRRKIETERLTGLGPPALTLRVESKVLHETLDSLASEGAVREHLDDFNKRVIDARRQLLGGPPVVTATRDIDDEIEQWRHRRTARLDQAHADRQAEEARMALMTRRERRRYLRSRV
jgi:hypothetical protein